MFRLSSSMQTRWLVTCASLVLVLGIATGRAAAQQRESGDSSGDESWLYRTELFQMLLEEQGLKPTQELGDAFAAPEESVIVITGESSPVWQREWSRLIEFTAQGGRLLIATDCSEAIRDFHIGPVMALQTKDRYLDYADCIRVTALEKSHPLTTNVESLVTNKTGWLSRPPDAAFRWTVVARLPRFCRPMESSEQPLIVAGRGQDSETGVIVLVADQSLFTNNMLWHGDNAVFAIRMSEFLSEGQRSRLVFVADGAPLPSYRAPMQLPPLPPLPEPDLAKLLRVANAAIRDVEESNLVNEALRDRPRHVRIPQYPRIILFVLGAAAFTFLLWKLVQQMNPRPAPPPARDMLTSRAMSSEHAGIRSELSVAAQLLARDFCRELTGSDLPEDWKSVLLPSAQSGMPHWKKSQRAQLKILLNLAVDGCSLHISPRRFRTIGQQIRELRQLHRALVPATAPVS